MFDFFDSLNEIIDAVSIHRMWLWILTGTVVILIWKHLKNSLKIERLEFEIKMMKEEIKNKIEEIEKTIHP